MIFWLAGSNKAVQTLAKSNGQRKVQMDKDLKTRVIAVLESGNSLTQDFFTRNQNLALVQFGEGNAEMLQGDPVVSVSWISLVDRGDDEVDALTEIYIGDMLADSVHAVS